MENNQKASSKQNEYARIKINVKLKSENKIVRNINHNLNQYSNK